MARHLGRLAFVGVLGWASAAAPPGFELVLFSEKLAKKSGAQCLDHTPAGYYIRKQDPNKFVIFLEGGGLCVEPYDCYERAKDGIYGSSKDWKKDRPLQTDDYMTTTASKRNPMQDWTHIYVPYCSGDLWMGTSPEHKLAILGLQMSGHLILDTVVDDLTSSTGIAKASDIVLSGTSAGGLGALHSLDWFAKKIGVAAASSVEEAKTEAAPPPRITGLSIAGLFMPKDQPVLFETFKHGSLTPYTSLAEKYLVSLESPFMNKDCMKMAKAKNLGDSYCFSASHVYPYVRTPFFVVHNLFDELQIQDLGTCLQACEQDSSPNSSEGKFIRYFGKKVGETLEEMHSKLPTLGWFVTSEFRHDTNFHHYFNDKDKVVKNMTLRSAWEAWYRGESVMITQETCNQNGPCKRDKPHEETADVNILV